MNTDGTVSSEKKESNFIGYKGVVLASFRVDTEIAAEQMLGSVKRETGLSGITWVSELGTKWLIDTDSESEDSATAEKIKYALIRQQGGPGNIKFDNVSERIRI